MINEVQSLSTTWNDAIGVPLPVSFTGPLVRVTLERATVPASNVAVLKIATATVDYDLLHPGYNVF